jgi:hypothetical protein
MQQAALELLSGSTSFANAGESLSDSLYFVEGDSSVEPGGVDARDFWAGLLVR